MRYISNTLYSDETACIVSILIPVYNREDYIGACIESAIKQTVTNIEIIIIDNASTDGTWVICQKYSERDSRIRIIRNEVNLEIGRAHV